MKLYWFQLWVFICFSVYPSVNGEECAKWNILKVIKMNGIIVRIHHDHAIILIMVIGVMQGVNSKQCGGRGGSFLFLNSDFECTQSQRQNLQAGKRHSGRLLILYSTFGVFSADWEIADYSITLTINMNCVRSQKNIGL